MTSQAWQNRGLVAKRRADFPAWALNPERRKRVLGVYQAYIRRTSVDVIAKQFDISVVQVYIDLKRARQELRIRLHDHVLDLTLEQVDRRGALIVEAFNTLAELRRTDITSFRARAEVDLLRFVAEQEKAIEELLRLRGNVKASQELASPEESDTVSERPIILRIDLRQPMITQQSAAPIIEGFTVPALEEDNGEPTRVSRR